MARFSTKFEYISLAPATADLLWIHTLLQEINIVTKPLVVLCDNPSAILLAHNPIMHFQTKHKEIYLLFVKEKVLAKLLTMVRFLGSNQIADVLTKPLSSTKFLELRHKLRVITTS